MKINACVKGMAGIIAAVLVCTFVAPTLSPKTTELPNEAQNAAIAQFPDVQNNYWATNAIVALAKGGLVIGNTKGMFEPAKNMTIAEFATIITRATGGDAANGYSYWASNSLTHCDKTLECLPIDGDYSKSGAFDAPCTREMAIYMIMEGVDPNPTENLNYGIQKSDIPDYGAISLKYRASVFKAYQEGITNGASEDGSFKPQAILSREEAVTMLYRAGLTEVVPPVEVPTEGKTNKQLFDEIATWDVWEPVMAKDGGYELYGKGIVYSGIIIRYQKNDLIRIDLNDRGTEYKNNAGHYQDIQGNEVEHYFNDNIKYVCATGYGYESRMLMIRILNTLFPTEKAEATQAFKDMMLLKVYESNTYETPSIHRWLDGRCLKAHMNSAPNYNTVFYIGDYANKEYYTESITVPNEYPICPNPYRYVADYFKAYELDRW